MQIYDEAMRIVRLSDEIRVKVDRVGLVPQTRAGGDHDP